MRRSFLIVILLAIAVLTAMAGLDRARSKAADAPIPEAQPQALSDARHIIWVWFENREITAINGTSAPYFTSFAAANVNFTNFYGVTHPSQPNYLDAWSGSNQGVTNDSYCTFSASVDSFAKQMTTAGRSWRVYAQNFPGNCFDGTSFTGGVDGPGLAGQYVRKHNPTIGFESVRLNPIECANIQPLANFDPTVDVAFVVPNMTNDMHDGTTAQGDAFLQAFVPLVTSSPDWAHTLLIVTFDEGTTNANGGGHIYTAAAAPWLEHANVAATYNHFSVLRTIEYINGLPYLGAAGTAATITEVLPPEVTPTPSPCTLYGADNHQRLFTLNTATGAGTLVGMLPVAQPTEIAYDPISGRAIVQDGGFTFIGHEFNILTGAGIGGDIDEGANFTGFEWVGPVLYATSMNNVNGPSSLRTLDPWTGTSTVIGLTGVGPVAGLAYNSNTGTMYGVTAGTGPFNLVTINLSTGAATVVGPLGIVAGSLKFGSDGVLYAGGARSNTGRLYRVNPATGAATLIGPDGFTDDITGLAKVCNAPAATPTPSPTGTVTPSPTATPGCFTATVGTSCTYHSVEQTFDINASALVNNPGPTQVQQANFYLEASTDGVNFDFIARTSIQNYTFNNGQTVISDSLLGVTIPAQYVFYRVRVQFYNCGIYSFYSNPQPLCRPASTPAPTPTRTPTPTPTPTSTPTPTPIPTPSPFPELDLTIGQSDSPDPVLTGHPLTYTVLVSNIPTALGGNACPIVRFSYPSGGPFVFISAGGTNGFIGTPDDTGVTFSGGCLSSINGTVTATLTIVLTPQTAGTLTSLGSNVIVDPGNLILESNENNNTAQTGTTTVITAPTNFDFDGDYKADISIFRPSVAEWYYQRSTNGTVYGAQFGASTDKPVPGDFTGDGRADIAFWRPSTGEWFVLRSEDSTYYAFPFGSTNDIPRPADYDGDGKADAAVYRPSISTWFVLRSSDGGVTATPFGISSDLPVPADYDGDGKADVAIYRTAEGQWWYLRSSNGSVFAATFGSSTDKPVPGDYTGDGKADVAFYRPSQGNWFVLRSEDSSYYAFPFGNSTDKPVPADYDGDGLFDAAVFRPSDTNWYILKSTGGVQIQPFGLASDIPLPGAAVP